MIVTDNSIKWLKFKELMGNTDAEAYKYYKRFMKKDGEQFMIVKTAHKSKYGDLQRSSYQMNNSLPTVDRKVLENIAKTSIDYYNNMIIDDDAFIEYLKIGASKKYSINNMLIDLDKINSHFRYTPFFKKKKSDMLSQFKNKRLKLGKLLQYGDNLTICGNPVALLKYITGELKTNDGYVEDDCFSCFIQRDDGIECYTTRFNNGECLAGFRSPHNSPNNIVHLINKHPDILQKYFPKLGDNVIVINGIYTDVQDRLNGQDLDTDSVLVTNQKDIVDLARKSYSEYATIINEIPLLGASEYGKDMESYYKMDYKIALSQNDVGYASNLAQLALSYYYDCGSKDNNLLNIFVICSILAQVAIDSSKRRSDVEVTSELRRLSIICKKIIESKWTDDKWSNQLSSDLAKMSDAISNTISGAGENYSDMMAGIDYILNNIGGITSGQYFTSQDKSNMKKSNSFDTGYNSGHLKGYAKGTKHVGGVPRVAMTNENGREIIVTKKGILTPVEPSDGIIPNDMTETLMKMAERQQNYAMNSNFKMPELKVKDASGNSVNNVYNTFTVQGDLTRDTLPELNKILDLASSKTQNDIRKNKRRFG